MLSQSASQPNKTKQTLRLVGESGSCHLIFIHSITLLTIGDWFGYPFFSLAAQFDYLHTLALAPDVYTRLRIAALLRFSLLLFVVHAGVGDIWTGVMATQGRSAPIPIPKPIPISGDGLFSGPQWSTLLALVDAAVPSIVVASSAGGSGKHIEISEQQYRDAYEHVRVSMAAPPSSDEFEEYLRARPCDNPRFVQNVKRTFQTVPAVHRKRLASALDLLE